MSECVREAERVRELAGRQAHVVCVCVTGQKTIKNKNKTQKNTKPPTKTSQATNKNTSKPNNMQTHDYYNNHSQKIQPQTKITAKIQANTSKKEKKTEKPSFFAGFCELEVLISTHPWGVAPACTSKIARLRFQPIILKY